MRTRRAGPQRRIRVTRTNDRRRAVRPARTFVASSDRRRREIGRATVFARGPIPQRVTRALVIRNPSDRYATTQSRAAESLSLRDGTRPSQPQLKAAGLSQNHILSDSWIRYILSGVRNQTQNWTNILNTPAKSLTALTRFFTALCGPTGAAVCQRFITGSQLGQRAMTAPVTDACLGTNNLRFDDARLNTQISNRFDPVIVNGRMSPNSMEIRDSVIGLASAGLISSHDAIDATSITINRETRGYVTSSSSSTTSLRLFDRPAPPARAHYEI